MKSLKTRLMELPTAYKVVGIGALIGVISVFSPWYADLDKFNSGYSFLGITGPLYVVGGTLLLGFGALLVKVLSKATRQNLLVLPIEDYALSIGVAIVSFYLVFVAYSVYFHPQFGLHITEQHARFGMLMAVIASFVVGYGGYLQLLSYRRAHKKSIDERESQVNENLNREHQQILDQTTNPNVTTDVRIKSEIRSTEENLTEHYGID